MRSPLYWIARWYSGGAKGTLFPLDVNAEETPLAVGTNDYVLTAASGEASGMKWAAAASSGAPTDADYLVKTANGSLSAERVVTDTATIATDWATAGQAKFGVVAGSIGPTQIASTAVTLGSYGSATQVGTFTVDADGRLTAAANVTITATGGGGGGDVTAWGDILLVSFLLG